MPGLSLMANAGVTAALPPSQAGGQTIASQAYGVTSGMADTGSKAAGFGTLSGATIGFIALAWLWWTLPR